MKRITSIMIILLMIFALSACKGVENSSEHNHTHDHTHSVDAEIDTADTEYSQTPVDATDKSENTGVTQYYENTENTDAVDEVVVRNEEEGPFKNKHREKIDVPFEEEHEQAQSIAEKRLVCDKYAQEWQTVARRYYDEIQNFKGVTPQTANYNTEEQLHEYVKQYDADWKANFDSQCELYLSKIIKDGENSEAGLVYSRFCYQSYREYALYLINIYEELYEFDTQS